jgi:hypothetical protein
VVLPEFVTDKNIMDIIEEARRWLIIKKPM